MLRDMLSLIRSLHDEMNVVVRGNDSTTNDIEVTNGLRQGCTSAPTLSTLGACARGVITVVCLCVCLFVCLSVTNLLTAQKIYIIK